eukprot:7985592-Alexandrium_andersonii.AAC.1
MSASLVGSEMCIRDRSSHVLHNEGKGKTLQIEAWRNTDSNWSSSMTHATVSYTHLTLPTICSV